MNRPTNSRAFYASSFYGFWEQLLQELHHLYVQCNIFMKPSFVAFTDVKLDKFRLWEGLSSSST